MTEILYHYTQKDAKELGELELWRESYRENCSCARAIEAAIRRDFDGMYLKENCAKSVISEFGFDRVNWVLANTLRELKDDGRFSSSNKQWASGFPVPPDKEHNWQFTVTSHPVALDGFVDEARKAWRELGLFDASHCVSEADGQIDYTGRVVVIRPDIFKDAYKTPENQLFMAESGFGCAPNTGGRKVFGYFLKDDEKTYFRRNELYGVLKDEFLPAWVREKLNKQNETADCKETQDGGISMR